jgi:hypothetical protein
MLSQTCARRELAPFVAPSLVTSPVHRGSPPVGILPVRRRGSSSAATLAWSEPLTALLRSAQSRVSSSRSLCKAAYEDPLRLPSESNAEPVITVAPQSAQPTHDGIARESAPSVARHRRVLTRGPFARPTRGHGCRAKQTARTSRSRWGGEGCPRRGTRSKSPPFGHASAPQRRACEDTAPQRHPSPTTRDGPKNAGMAMRGDLTSAYRAIG